MGNIFSVNPLVTVQLTCYNHEKYIANAIESVMNSTYRNFELYISDDGSTDSSRNIILEIYEKYGKDSRIHLFLKEKNTCFEVIDEMKKYYKGKYICGLGGDDEFKPDKIEKQVKLLEEYEGRYKVCFTHVEIKSENESKKEFFMNLFNRHFTDDKYHICNEMFSGENIFCAPSFLMDREVYNELGGFDYTFRMLQDYRLWIKLLQKYDFIMLDEPLTVYGVVEGSLSTYPTIKNRIRMYNEAAYIQYEEIKNMPNDVFDKVFPNDGKSLSTDEDFLCRKFYYFLSSELEYIRPLALRFYYENSDNNGFVQCIKEKYQFTRMDAHILAEHGIPELILINNKLKEMISRKRLLQESLFRSDEDMVEEMCNMLENSDDNHITIDHICSLYECCKKMENGEKQFSDFITEIVRNHIMFT